jgi:subtilisin family serine protease
MKHTYRWFKVAAALVAAAMASLSSLSPASAQPFALIEDEPGGPLYLGGQILVQFKPDTTDAHLLDAVRRGGLGLMRHIRTGIMQADGHPGVSHMATTLPVRQAIRALQNHPAVEFAEPNWVYTHQAIPNDPFFTGGSLWGMYGDLTDPKNQYGSQAAEAWAAGYTGSSSVVVGIIDEGVQVSHPDLNANIWRNPDDTADDGIDNDGNGYIDDVYGWDFYENNNSVYDGTGDDHGTHVTGTIGAVGNNDLGVVGVNWNVKMISAKFLGPDGGSTADAIEAVDYFTALKKRTLNPVNIVALNNSWGGGGYSQGLHDAIIRAADAGILFVAAAGNGNIAGRAINIDSSPYYPASYNTTVGTTTKSAATYDAVIAVTAIDSAGKMPRWANYGVKNVDLGAPGVTINSTLPVNNYGPYDGTSMATPHVTGAIALYASTHPDASAAQIKSAILNATTPTSSLASKTVTGGRLDLSTVITPPDPPPAPTGLTATAGDTYVSLSWNASAGASSYNVSRSTDDTAYTLIAGQLTDTTYSDLGLQNGTTYYYQVTAENSQGKSAPAEVSDTPVAATSAPNAPSNLAAVTRSQSEIALSWDDNSDNESGFRIERMGGLNGPQTTWVGPNLTSYVDTGLEPNTQYTYRLASYNSYNDLTVSESVSASATTFVQPSAVFVAPDTTTKGTWKKVYGIDGYHICRVSSGTAVPYVSGLGHNVAVRGATLYPWIDSTEDTRGIQRPEPETDHFAHCYHSSPNFAPGSFYVDMVLPERSRVSLYFVDWDTTDRRQTITITDAGDPSVVLNTQSISSSFNGGLYLTWELGGEITIKISWTGGGNAVLSGIFFDPTSAQPPADNPPTVSITSPSTGATVSGTTTITATASDDLGVTQVEFFVDGESIGTGTSGADGWSVEWETKPVVNGTYTLTAKATDTSGQTTTSSSVNVTVKNDATSTTTLHCGDLDGVATSSGSNWKATVTVLIHDTNHQPVSGATVTGTWSGGTSGTPPSVITDANGKASFTTGSLVKRIGSVTFSISNVTHSTWPYDSASNHDPDGDSNGTIITVIKP